MIGTQNTPVSLCLPIAQQSQNQKQRTEGGCSDVIMSSYESIPMQNYPILALAKNVAYPDPIPIFFPSMNDEYQC